MLGEGQSEGVYLERQTYVRISTIRNKSTCSENKVVGRLTMATSLLWRNRGLGKIYLLGGQKSEEVCSQRQSHIRDYRQSGGS